MSDTTADPGTSNEPTGEPAGDDFKAITSQDDLNRVINERLTRERAKFADYKDVKAKAAKFDELENANRSEAERAQARIAELEAELTGVRGESTRLKIASEHGITDADDIELFLTGKDEETLTRQAKRLADRIADRKKNGNHVPREGAPSSPAENDALATVRGLFGGG